MYRLMGFLSKRQRKSAISKHCQSTYHDTLIIGIHQIIIISSKKRIKAISKMNRNGITCEGVINIKLHKHNYMILTRHHGETHLGMNLFLG